jgi:hypothetical protein
MTTPVQFKIGEAYHTRSFCDYDCIFSFLVTARTAKFVTFMNDHNQQFRVKVSTSTWDGQETEVASPMGRYSMSPIVVANRTFA